MRAKVKAGDSDSAAFCNRLSDLVILAAGFGVDLDSPPAGTFFSVKVSLASVPFSAAANWMDTGSVWGTRRSRTSAIHKCGYRPRGKFHHHKCAVSIPVQSPVRPARHPLQRRCCADALCLYPPARRILILQSKVDGVHQHILATVLGMFYAPAAGPSPRPMSMSIYPRSALVTHHLEPFRRSVNGLGGRLALILARISGYRRPRQTFSNSFGS